MDMTTTLSQGFYVTGEEKVRVNLVTGLEFVIARIQGKLDQGMENQLSMYKFDECALGTALPERIRCSNEEAMIKKYFGVKPKSTEHVHMFSSLLADDNIDRCFTPRTAKVMNLFSSNVGNVITATKWLKLANNVLLELKETK